ncbi:MAG: ABC transporter ATP-binding protein [Clostridiaceae bacterium]
MKEVWSNLFFLWNRYEIKGIRAFKYFGLYGLHIIAMITNAVMTVVVPAMAISVFSAGTDIWRVLLAVALLGGARSIQQVLHDYCFMRGMDYRIVDIGKAISYLMSLPSEEMQGAQGQETFGSVHQANFMGNEQGSEGFLHNFWGLVASLVSITVYVFMSMRLQWFWIILILLPSLGRGILTYKYNEYAKTKDSLDKELFFKREYLERMVLRSEAGKDHRLFPMRKLFQDKFKEYQEENINLRKSLYSRLYYRDTVGIILELIRDGTCFILLLMRVREGMAVEDFVLYYGIVLSLSSYVHTAFENAGKLSRNNVIVSNYKKVFDYQPYDKKEWSDKLPQGKAEIRFEDVWYRYDENSPWIIKNMHLNIQAGEKVALVGENGAGKTTMMKLACGLLTPVRGRILFNGVDLQKVNPKERYKAVSMVFQEVLIFAMSIGENICCCPEKLIDEERLWGVIEKAGLTEVIRALPDGWRTPMTTYVEPGGINLSGGQNQRLMLARALYKGGDFLVLDEPTSALDPLAEEALYEEYYRFTKDQTAVFISHRLSSTQFCDRVIFLKEGRIVQSGTHKDLASKEGPYKIMFDTQARYYQKEVLV